MMTFVDRVVEQKRLRVALERTEASFVVLYGRRRCGKSRLLRQVLDARDVYFMADQSDAVQQRALFARVVASRVPGFDRAVYPDWTSLFEALNKCLHHPLFGGSGLPQTFRNRGATWKAGHALFNSDGKTPAPGLP